MVTPGSVHLLYRGREWEDEVYDRHAPVDIYNHSYELSASTPRIYEELFDKGYDTKKLNDGKLI